MIDASRQNAASNNEGKAVVTIGRDPAWTHRAMADLFSHANATGFMPVRWELGYFNARDLVAARSPGYQSRPWQRLETVWGCSVAVVSFFDMVALEARAPDARDGEPVFKKFVAGGGEWQG